MARISNQRCTNSPEELDKATAMAKLETMGLKIDKWTPEQEAYAKAYSEGT